MKETTGEKAQTIHRTLEVKSEGAYGFKFGKNEKTPLEGDAIIIDESSMIDMELMASVLKAIPEGMKLILVGDNGIVLIESNETEDGEPETIDGANPYDENTYRVWYKLNLKSLAPEGYTVSDDQKQNLVPASDAVEVEEANIQEQDVYIFGSEDMHDVVLHITYNDASLDYNLRTDDYDGFYDENEYGTPDAAPLLDVISTGFYYIQEDMNTFPDITVDWNDSDGNPHHGTYTEGSVTEE